MPRTKASRKRKSDASEAVEDFLKQANLRIHKKEIEFDIMTQNLTNAFDLVMTSLPSEILRELTLGDLSSLDERHDLSTSSDDNIQINVIPPSTVKSKKPKRQTAVSTDDGYVTEGYSQQPKPLRASRIDKTSSAIKRPVGRPKRSISADQSRPKSTALRSSPRGASCSRAKNEFTTPAAFKNQKKYGPVTPKMQPNTPMSVLRRPRDGEMALSMQGSPLLVSAVVPDRTANINVPLRNGNIISLLPNDGLRVSLLPSLDQSTLKQLRTLMGHIEKVVGKRP